MIYTLSPLPAVVFPTASMSIVICASSAKAVSDITGAVLAVVDVLSLASIVIFVESIVVPASLISIVTKVPPVATVVNEALTADTVKAYGIRNVNLVPVVSKVVSSEQANTKL